MIDTVAAAAVLGAITFLEGVRQLPPQAIVLRRLGVGTWHFVRRNDIGAGLRLVSWCLPLAVPIVFNPTAPIPAVGVRRSLRRMRARIRRTKRQVAWLQALGSITIIVLVVVLPMATSAMGMVGLLMSAVALCLLSIAQAMWTARILRRNGMSAQQSAMASLKLLSPFSAPRAAEIVCTNNVTGVPAITAACALLGEEAFVRALRPMVFDLVRTRDADLECLTLAVDADRLSTLLRTPPAGFVSGAFCPRCGTEFAASVARCSDCDEVELIT